MKKALKTIIATIIMSLTLGMSNSVFAAVNLSKPTSSLSAQYSGNLSSIYLKKLSPLNNSSWQGNMYTGYFGYNQPISLDSNYFSSAPSTPVVDKVITKDGVDYPVMKVKSSYDELLFWDCIYLLPCPDGYDRYIDYKGTRYYIYYEPQYGFWGETPINPFDGDNYANGLYVIKYYDPEFNAMDDMPVVDFIQSH